MNVLFALCLLLASSCSYADKIGTVDKQVLGQDSKFAKDVHERMRKEFSSRQEALVAKEKTLMAKFEALERDKDVISEAERIKKEAEINKLKQSLQAEGDAFQNDVMQRQEKETAAFDKMLTEVLAEVCKTEKLDYILPTQAVMYSARKSDYTYQALQALDKRYKEKR